MHALFLQNLSFISLICKQKKWGDLRLYAHHYSTRTISINRFNITRKAVLSPPYERDPRRAGPGPPQTERWAASHTAHRRGRGFHRGRWAQVDLPLHPTPRQSKQCAKAAPNGMDNAVNVRSRAELSAQVDRNVFCASRKASSSGTSRHLFPAQRGEGRHRGKPPGKTDRGECVFLGSAGVSTLARRRYSYRSPQAV